MKLLALAVAGALSIAAPMTNTSREQEAAFQQKLQRIVRQAESKSAEPRQTVVTEGEVNSYLKYDAGAQLPTGVTDPSIAIQSKGRLSGRAIVDLDVIRQKKSSGGWFDPVSYLTGRLPITAVGVLTTKEGTGRFELESAAVAGVPIPKTFLQEIVSYYTRTADHPAGIDIDAPFELPAEIDRIDADNGKAVIVQ